MGYNLLKGPISDWPSHVYIYIYRLLINHYLLLLTFAHYCTVQAHPQHNTDFTKTNQNEVVQICMNFFEYL